MKEDKDERIVIMNKGVGAKYERQFFLDIQDAILNGYRIADNTDRSDVSMRMFKGRIGRAVLYLMKDEKEEFLGKNPEIVLEDTEEVSEGSEEKAKLKAMVQELSSYKEMKKLAEENGLILQDKIYNPVAVKKNLLEQLAN